MQGPEPFGYHCYWLLQHAISAAGQVLLPNCASNELQSHACTGRNACYTYGPMRGSITGYSQRGPASEKVCAAALDQCHTRGLG
jgi:hypothetical protein